MRPRSVVLSLLADVVLIVVFAVIGRASHGEDLDLPGILTTAWPFLIGLVAGWLVCLAWRAPFALLRTGVPVWAVTVVGGMLLRAVSGQGVQAAFVIVAAVVLAVFLIGWRVVAALVRRVVRRG